MSNTGSLRPTDPSVPAARSQPPEPGGTPAVMLMRIARWLVLFVYVIAMISVVVLLITFFLRLFGANPSTPFVEWMYRSADRFMKPFRGIFPPVETGGDSVLDVSVLFAMLMYGLLAVGVHALVEWLDRKLFLAGLQRESREHRGEGSSTVTREVTDR